MLKRQFHSLFAASILAAALISCASAGAQKTAMVKKGMFPQQLYESSGLIFTPQGLFSLSDDKRPEFHRVDTTGAEILQTIVVRDITFEDKEAISFDGDFLYIGDFGNNDGDRDDLKIVKIKAGDVPSETVAEVEGEVIEFYYPEQVEFGKKKGKNDFDCEAMVVHGESIYLFTKQRSDHHTTLYAVPNASGRHAAEKKAVFDAQGRVSDAALSPDGSTLLLLGYQKKHHFPFIWQITEFSGADFFIGHAEYELLSKYPVDFQTEGIAFSDNENVFISCESSDDVKAALYRVRLIDLMGK